MERSREIFLINDQVKALKGEYEPDGTPSLLKTFDPTIKVGDYLVVQSTTRHKITTVKVTEVNVDFDMHGTTPMQWVISKVDLNAYTEMLENEDAAIRKLADLRMRREREQLRKTMLGDYASEIDGLAIAQIAAPTKEDVTGKEA